MNRTLRRLLLAAGILVAGQAVGQVTLYEHDGFAGRAYTANRTVNNFDRLGFNDVASSARVRGGTWELCEDMRFGGKCVTLQPGDYPSLRAVGLNDRISSVREVERVARNDGRRFNNSDRYEYGSQGWRYDRWEDRWERY